jgi:SAM-dependent methyltransferase
MSKSFDEYALYYDLFYGDKDYVAEAAYTAGLIRRHAPGATRILELGCGTGGHAIPLAADGFSVTGIDLSHRMLETAEQRKRAAPSEIAERLAFMPGDARHISLGTTFDAVIAMFHVLSYQTATADVVALLESAARHLEPGGILVFDFWHGPAVLHQKPHVRISRKEHNGILVERLAEPDMRVADNCVTVRYTIRVDADPNLRPKEFAESHEMRYFFMPELEYLGEARFDAVESLAWLTDRPPGIEDWAAVTVLRRR